MRKEIIIPVILAYFLLIWLIALFTGGKQTDNKTFFTANRKSPWWLVSIAMIGTSVSGVSFISVPGMVGNIHFAYLQTVAGFFAGYLIIANVLLPLYYKMNLTSIYGYLKDRFGKGGHLTSAWIFLISKAAGASARLYIVALILFNFVFEPLGFSFVIPVIFILFVIWLYTYRSGVKSILWTDLIQTIIFIVSMVMMLVEVLQLSDISFVDFTKLWWHSDMTDIFVWDDWFGKQHFLKQFGSGVLIAIVMTGLDQDMMQKNLTCKTLKEAQKNMRWYGFAFIPLNFLFLLLGFAILLFAESKQIALPVKTDEILPAFAMQYFSTPLFIIFILGISAAALSSADSALTSLTTSIYVDILNKKAPDKLSVNASEKRKRMLIHASVTVIFVALILIFRMLNNTNVIDAIYIMASYTYGPLLGMFSFGILTQRKPLDKLIPVIALISPLICFLTDKIIHVIYGYSFGYELLLLNGMITFAGLYLSSLYGNKIR